jgi:hypothetical protein
MWPFKDVKMLERELDEHREYLRRQQESARSLILENATLRARIPQRDPKTGRYMKRLAAH